MEEQFKEIEGLLETTQTQIHQTPAEKIKKYVRLVFPHVALVTVVCIYAMIGAYIFYRLESPNEDRLKTIGRSSILDMRSHLLSIIREGELNKDDWKDQVEGELLRFNDKIYKSFKEQYVRYADVRLAAIPDSSEEKDDDRVKRHRGSKSRSEKGEKLWTASSALFFAATTMATIGYGNIVPATSSGRIACVVFALFGAPLAIITIGDLGKFLSECTIWLYKQMQKGKVSLRARWKQMRGTDKCNLDDCEEQSDKSSKSQLDWEDMDKTEVPVLMVFTILLLYIAFGGILFSFLEGWTYMDAFYYSFISLTTIGFGDIVPENHDYIVLMLIYLGVGLAVTTMCIDLVGIQYIQKIHYFGRKFRGTDILHLLKRRRMIERRLAMGHGDELLQRYIQQIQKELEEAEVSEDEDVPEEMEPLKEISLKAPSPDWQIDDALVSSRYSYKFPCSERIPSPNVLSIRSFRTPSIYSNSSASARSMMLSRYQSRGGSWDESGPSLSDRYSLSTEPSVHIRQDYWDNFTSPQPSITSFKFEFPPPSPDYNAIAADARRSRRLCSCPNSSFSFPSHSNSVRKLSAVHSPHAESLPPSPLYMLPTSFQITEPFMLSKLAAECDAIDRMTDALLRFKNPEGAPLAPQDIVPTDLCDPLTAETPPTPLHVPSLDLDASPTPPRSNRGHSPRFHTTLFPIPETRRPSSFIDGGTEEVPAPLLKRKKKERLAKLNSPLHNVDWLNISPRSKEIKDAVRDDLPRLFDCVRTRRISEDPSDSPSVVLVSPRNPVGLACMEDWDSYIRMLEEYDKPYERWGSPLVESICEVSDEEQEETSLRYSIPSPDDLPSPHTPSIYSVPSPPPSLESPEYTSSSPSIPSPMSLSPQTPSPIEFPSPVSPVSTPRDPTPISPPPEEPIPGPSSAPIIMPPVISTPLPRTPSEPSTSPPPEPTPPQVPIFVPHQVAAPLDEMESSMLSSPLVPAWTAMQSPVPAMPSTSFPIPTVVRAEVPLTQVLLELEKQKELTIQEQIIPEYNVEAISSLVAESSSEDEAPGGYDLDLGAFELVDSGLTPETLLSTEEPVIFHEDMPVHSVHHDTVQTEAALANLMSAPNSMLSGGIPPIMVDDNYCFVVDGERVRMGDILGDDQWWRHTSRPTKYFYSEDLRQFHRVNCITAKGKVITAKLATPSSLHVSSGIHHPVHQPSASSSSTPRSSVSGSSSNRPSHHNANKVPLNHVYKVIRFYSFWKTCTSFHRIVTMIDKVSGDERTANPDFKKRLFVQYLWRNAKAVEKARVQKEFDPRRQRLLRFVTDPAARKRFVEDDTCTFAVIVDDNPEISERRSRFQRIPRINESFGNESEDSTIDFPVQVNALPAGNMNLEEDGEVLMHYGDSNEPIPVFSVDEMPLDGPTTLTNTLRCPVKYISKVPPSLVVDNFCFICDGDEVKVDEILFDQKWWKQTSSSTRFYSSDNLTTFNQVTLLTCRGEMRGAYRSRSRGGGLVKVHLDQVFRVSRYFSSWRTCHAFHRIVSVINPVTKEGEHINNFKKRIFVQYFWREEKPADRARVTREYMEGRLSPRNSLAVPSVSHSSRSWFPLSNTSYSSLSSHDSISPRTSANLREDSKWRVLGRMYRRGMRKPFSRTDTTASLPHNGNTKRLSVNSLPDPYPQSNL